jgi:hypothetical protein
LQVQPHIENLSQTILELEQIERESISPSTEGTDASFMDSYLNLADPIPEFSYQYQNLNPFDTGDIFIDANGYQPAIVDGTSFQSGYDSNSMAEMMSSEWLENFFKQSTGRS